ncbi:hypothetical protein SESBI_21973 [Sesbania bispinosa]|nr:hypothetical protein SESBI_21973 [Sesbania bispinosa]
MNLIKTSLMLIWSNWKKSDDNSSDEEEDDSQLQEDTNYEAESIGDFAPFDFHPSSTMNEENVSSSPHTTSERLNSDSEKLQPMNCDTVNLESKVHNTPRNQYRGENTQHFSTFVANKNYNSSLVSPDREARDEANLFREEAESMATKYSACKNQYLAAQDACDKTSMLAYNLIGHMLEEFAVIEGLELDSSKSLYLRGDSQIDDKEGTKELPSSGKDTRCSAIVRVIERLIPSFPDSSMERLKMLMDL